MSGGIALGDGVTSRADSLEDKEEQHANTRGDKKDPSSDPFDEEGSSNSPRQIPNLEDTIDEELDGCIGDTDSLEHFGEVVRDETITGPLGKPSDGENDRQTLTITGGPDQGRPTNGCSNSPVEIDCGLDFFVLVLNEGVLFVTVGVVVSQEAEGIRIPTLADQPTRRFGAEPKKTKLEDGGDTLEGGWDPPRPRGVDLESTEGTPSGNDSTGVPEGVVEGAQRGAVGRIG